MKKNIIANMIARFWSMLSNFLFIPLYIRYLGFDSYSIISFTLIIAGLMAILDAGLTATLSREFARSDNQIEDKLKIYRTLETCYIIVVAAGVLLLFLLSGLISTRWINNSSINHNHIALYIKIFSFDIGFQFLFRFYMGGLLGLEKQVKANIYQIAWAIVRNGLVVFVIMFSASLKLYFVWQSLSSVLFSVLLKIALEKDLYSKYTFKIRMNIESDVLKSVWKFALGMMLITIVNSLNTQMDKLAISKLISLNDLGYYTLAISLSHGITAVASPFSKALLPRFTSMYSKGNNMEASILFQRIGILLSVIVFSLFANMLFFGEQILFVWTGDIEISSQASIYLPLIAFSISMLALAIIPFSIAIANGYTRLNNLIGIVSIIITLPGYWIATKKFGAMGAAMVFCCVQSLTTLVYFYFINKKFIKTHIIKTIYTRLIIRPLLVSIFITFLIHLIPIHNVNNRLILLLWIGLSTIATLLLTTIASIPHKEIKNLFRT